MLDKLCTASRLATLLVVALFFSCNRSDDKGPVGATQLQSQSEMQASTPSQPKPQVEDIKDYNGVPWGMEFEKFKELKKYEGELKNSNELDKRIAVVLGTPIYKDNIVPLPLLQDKFIPAKFYIANVSQDDVYYIFYDGKFVMAFSTVMAKNYDQYYETLSKKYAVVDRLSKEVTFPPRIKHPDKIEAIQFKGGNTRIYLIRKEETEEGWGTMIGVSVLYIPDNYFNSIRSEILRNEKMSPEKHQEEESMKRDLDKLK